MLKNQKGRGYLNNSHIESISITIRLLSAATNQSWNNFIAQEWFQIKITNHCLGGYKNITFPLISNHEIRDNKKGEEEEKDKKEKEEKDEEKEWGGGGGEEDDGEEEEVKFWESEEEEEGDEEKGMGRRWRRRRRTCNWLGIIGVEIWRYLKQLIETIWIYRIWARPGLQSSYSTISLLQFSLLVFLFLVLLFPAEVSVVEHLLTVRIYRPIASLARLMLRPRNFLEAFVQRQIVSDRALPAAIGLLIVQEVIADETVDGAQCQSMVTWLLDGHCDQGRVWVGRSNNSENRKI